MEPSEIILTLGTLLGSAVAGFTASKGARKLRERGAVDPPAPSVVELPIQDGHELDDWGRLARAQGQTLHGWMRQACRQAASNQRAAALEASGRRVVRAPLRPPLSGPPEPPPGSSTAPTLPPKRYRE